MKNYFLNKNKRLFKIRIKQYKYLYKKNFYLYFKFQTQRREGYNISRAYLLNSKLWYFQKTHLIKLPQNFKFFFNVAVDNTLVYKKIQSKIKWLY